MDYLTESGQPFTNEVLDAREQMKKCVLQNAFELRKRERREDLNSKRKRFLQTNDINYYLETSVQQYFADLKQQREQDAPQEDMDDLIAFSIKMIQEDNIKLDFMRLEQEILKMEQEEQEFFDFCREMTEQPDASPQ